MSLDKMASHSSHAVHWRLIKRNTKKKIKNSNNIIMENIDWKLTVANKCLTHLTLALKWVLNPNLQNESLTLISTMSP